MLNNIETRVGIFVLCALGVFVYMGFHIGAFRFDKRNYKMHELYFKDISGLARKADVKIAGVRVGWVENVGLLANPDNIMTAQAQVMIRKEYALYQDAYAMVRQDGLLGPKYIEIVVGDPLLSELLPGQVLSKKSVEPASIDELMLQCKEIANNVQDVTYSLKEIIGTPEGQDSLRNFITNISRTADKLAGFSEGMQTAVLRNQDRIDDLFAIGTNIKNVTDTLQSDMFPVFQTSIQKISDVFDRDFDRIANALNTTAESLGTASNQATQGIKSLASVAQKIDEGKGLLGKIINEDETYHDIRFAVSGLKNYFARMDRIQILFDSHFETMHRLGEHYNFEDSKGYLDVRIHPNEDYFYLVQIASSEKGYLYRDERLVEYVDKNLTPVNLTERTDGVAGQSVLLEDLYWRKRTHIKRDSFKLGIQFGKIFGDIALRFGLFEGSAGMGVDVDIPFNTDNFRWVTSFEMFDFNGQNRIRDRRPHFKWLNKMYVMRNLYFVFGADDFASKRNANAFLGGGLRFGDDDIKYFLSSFAGIAGGATS